MANEKGKLEIQKKVVKQYEAAVDTLKNLAQDMERLRKDAKIDYEAITYGDIGKYKKRYGEV